MHRKTRNLAARSPLMRKGGVHRTTKSTHRAAARIDLDEAYAEWREERRQESTPPGRQRKNGDTPKGGRRFFSSPRSSAATSGLEYQTRV